MSGLNRHSSKSGGYYVESTNRHRLAITKLDHLAAHIRCLHIITAVVLSWAWPSNTWMVRRSTPSSNR
jgi:hypothetical protein